MGKIVTSAEAAAMVHTGDTIATSGFVGIGTPDTLLACIRSRFEEHGDPRDLTLLFAAGQGDGKDRGLNRLAAPGLLRRVIGGHWGLIPKVSAMAMRGEIEAWNLPQGVISHLYREIAAGNPGYLSRIGLHTFVDPRVEGGKVNARSTEDWVRVMDIDGSEILFYRALPIDVALLRGTTADENGNITMEREALTLDNLAMAMAARNSGGKVLVQVERIASARTLDPRLVKIPRILVDAVVVSEPDMHPQTYGTVYSAAFAHKLRVSLSRLPRMPLGARKVIARRAAMELPVDGVINLGIGMPEGVALVAAEEGLINRVTLTAEPGVVGGVPASGIDFGAAINPDALIDQNQQFDFYDGGGLDLAVLGMAQMDAEGNVNVSRFGTRLTGAGGFINISQSARVVVFTGTFSTTGLQVSVGDGRLHIDCEGAHRKLVRAVQQITFNGKYASSQGQRVLYVTERAVFQATPDGLMLIEVAPGLDLHRDVLGQMDFTPLIAQEVARMDPRLFKSELMGLADDLIEADKDRAVAGNTPTSRGVE